MKNRHFLQTILVILLNFMVVLTVGAIEKPLRQRANPRPQTTQNVPHVQIGIKSVPEIDTELLRQVSTLASVEIRPTVVSLPGAKGFWLNENLPLAHPEVIVGGREFAHIHPDGSLHASLPPKRAHEAVKAGWGIRHPWANQRKGWEGFVMLYTPQSMEELKVVFQLIVDSYNFVTGQNVPVTR
jgi:hypothetical protein